MAAPSIQGRVAGAEQLVALARAVKATGDRELRKDMLRGLRNAAKPLVDAIKEGAALDLPGGLAEQYQAAKIAPRTRTSGKNAGLRLQGPKKGKGADMGRVDDTGQARHPVFGDRKAWAATDVSAGFARRAVERAAPKAEDDIQSAMQDTLARIKRSV